MTLRNHPFLDRQEFAEACHHLDRAYRRATLGPLRKNWKLRLCTALDTVFSFDGAHATYVQITRPLSPALDHDGLALDLARFSVSDQDPCDDISLADEELVDAEESDSALLLKASIKSDPPHVTYEIHLHPTYRVPCLWFMLHNLPPDEPFLSIDTVFRRLVPDEYKNGLENSGGVGGISVDHHPITGIPFFFLHPCLLGDAMSSFECTRQNYLTIWLGLVGGCVGLWVPKEMAVSIMAD